jgi:hypothetical protein
MMRLCYVEDHAASMKMCYFTDDFENQWGDDWDDAPYEHNAGVPYESHGNNIQKIVVFTNLLTPRYDADGIEMTSSIFSVEDINNKAAPWLRASNLTKRYEGIDTSIWAGTPIDEFMSMLPNSARVYNDEPEDLGVHVWMRFRNGSIYGYSEQELPNITEIHYGYRGTRVAFESNVHSTGFTYDICDIDEFETRPAYEVKPL